MKTMASTAPRPPPRRLPPQPLRAAAFLLSLGSLPAAVSAVSAAADGRRAGAAFATATSAAAMRRSAPATTTTTTTTSASRGSPLRPRAMRQRLRGRSEGGRRPLGVVGDVRRSDDDPRRDRGGVRRKVTRLEARAADEDDGATSSSLRDILLLVLPLLLVYVSNQWSRYSISYLVDFSSPDAAGGAVAASAFEAMNVDLGFDQSQYGLLASTAFTTLFALSSLIAGNLADKYDRKVLTLGSCAVWSLATLYTSQAGSYEEVLAARVVMGGACAFAVPAAYTLVAEKVSKDKLALSNSIYGSGVYLGGALASLSLLLDGAAGWRGTLTTVGGFGIVSAAAAGALLPPDGDRGGSVEEEAAKDAQSTKGKDENGLVQNARQILAIPRVRLIFLASFLRFCSGLMIGVWAAPYYKQAFPDNAAEYAVVNAFIVGAMGASSGILGGYIADGLGAWIKEPDDEASSGVSSIIRDYFDERSIPLLLPIVGSSLAIPAWYLTTHTAASAPNGFEIAMFWLAVEYLVAECWFGPTIAVLQSAVGPTRTGTTQGLFVLTGALGNLAPTALGWVYGNQVAAASGAESTGALADLLGWGVGAGYLLSAVIFAASVRADGEAAGTAGKQN